MIEWLTSEWGLGVGAIVRISGRHQASLGDSRAGEWVVEEK